MGRPAWANDEQWAWLKSQATEYLKIKGKKGETAKFWPVFLDGWKEQWPKPALTDLVREEGSGASTGASTNPSAADTKNEGGANNTAANDADAGDELQSASAKNAKKPKKPLILSVVRAALPAMRAR